MLSNPVFSKRDATIIAVLSVIGVAMTIESHHHVRIVAPTETVEMAPMTAATAGVQLDPSGSAAPLEPAFTPSDR